MKDNKNDKNELKFNSLKINAIDVPYTIDVKGNGRWVKAGVDNKLPQKLYNYYNEVSNLQSIILTYIDYLVGGGIYSDFDKENSYGEDILTVVRKTVEDYCIFGSYSLEIIRNAKGEIADIIYQDVRNVRISEDFKTAYLSNEWGQFNAKNTVELPLYNKKEIQNHFLYYFNGYSRGWYGQPFYFAALKSIEILRQIRNFHLNNLMNNFSSNAIITFCSGIPSKTVQDEIYEKLNQQYCGTENTSKIFVNYADNIENAPKIERLESDNFGDLYNQLITNSIDDVY